MVGPSQIPFLTERNGTLFFRRRVPARFRDRTGFHEWKRALGRETADSSRIRLELRVLTEATDEALARLERGLPVSSSLLEAALAALYPDQNKATLLTIDDAVRAYQADRGLTCLRKPEQVAVDQFKAMIGEKRIFEISRSDVRRWVDLLRTKRGQSGTTIRRRIGAMKAIFSLAAEEADFAGINPFRSARIAGAEEGGYRLPFERDHLKAIDAWLQSGAGKKPTGQLIRLIRLTGARPLEIGGLEASDLNLVGEIPSVSIRPNANRGLKTRSSQRVLPLIGDALAAAKELREHCDTGPLFPPNCHATGTLSARLNKALRAAGVPAQREFTAYSFRHTMEEALRLTDASFEVQQAVLGHAPRTMTDRYGAKRVALGRIRLSLIEAEIHLFALSNKFS
ncbi:tyrosine-type recombinase/integrase [Maricaulaceae bacterium MS644]